VAARIKKAAGATPVSAWVTGVIEDRLEDAELERAWAELVEDVRPTKKEEEARRADALFKRLTKPPRRRRAPVRSPWSTSFATRR
jgi:hypothetical protein